MAPLPPCFGTFFAMIAKLLSVPRLLWQIARHPLNRRHPVKALIRWGRWQLGSRLLPGQQALVPFVEDSRLIAAPGLTGMTLNIYFGLAEYREMGLLLHLLRPEDLFVDIGGNVGVYTVLASAVVGAESLVCEPVPASAALLATNLRLNAIEARVRLEQVAVGAEAGSLTMTGGLDTTNHVLTAAEQTALEPGACLEVPVCRLDDLLAGRMPRLIKVDVEGFEPQVLAGAPEALAAPDLWAVLLEVNEAVTLFGGSAEGILNTMRDAGFSPWRYDPLSRRLQPLSGADSEGNNTLFLRDQALEAIKARLAEAPCRQVGHERL